MPIREEDRDVIHVGFDRGKARIVGDDADADIDPVQTGQRGRSRYIRHEGVPSRRREGREGTDARARRSGDVDDPFHSTDPLPGSAEVTFAFATVCRIHAVSSKRLAMPTRASSKYTLPPERFGPYRRNWRETRPDLADPNWVRSTTTSCHPAARLCDCVVWNVGPTYAVTLKVRGRFAVETRTQRTKRSDIDQSTGWERCTPAHGSGPGRPALTLSPSIPGGWCAPAILIHGTPFNPTHVPRFVSMLSHSDWVVGDEWRNSAVLPTLSQDAVTFPRGLGSQVHGEAEEKSEPRT